MTRQRLASLLIALLVGLTLPAPVFADAPVAANDSDTVAEDSSPTTIDVLLNDSSDAGSMTVTFVSDPSNGTATHDGSTVTYEPDPNYFGMDSFTYDVTNLDGTSSATVDITITAGDDPPEAGDDDVTVTEDTPETVDVLDNDMDVDNVSILVTAVTQGAKGSVTITNGGDDVRYVPDPNATGSDSFTYTITAGGDSDTASVDVTIDPVNDDPDADDDAATLDEDATTDIDVLADDDDVDGDEVTIIDVTDGSRGTTSIVAGKVRYDPDQDDNGADSFTYTISDGNGGEDTATVDITIDPVNDDPVADDDSFGVAEEAPATALAVLAGDIDVDGDDLTITAKTNGAKGIVVITGGGTGLTYRPNANQSGADSFTYTISDGNGGSDTATVTMDIGGENDAPNAVNDPSMSVPHGAGPRALDVLANDSDPDGDTLTIIAKTDGAHGTVAITGSGTGLTYNPTGIYKGTDTFKYTVSDGNGGTDQATVVVTVVEDTVKPIASGPVQSFFYQTVARGSTAVRLSWGATDTGGTGVSSYKLQVSVDGGTYATISSSTTRTTWTRALTTDRTYRFRVRATDKEGNVGTYAYGPTIRPTRYAESSSRISYVGTWKRTDTPSAIGGHTRKGTSPSKRAVFTFTGWDVGWIASRLTSSGKAQVYVDGNLVRTVDLDRASTRYRKLVFSQHFETLESHTLEIRPVGDGRVDIDGFVVNR